MIAEKSPLTDRRVHRRRRQKKQRRDYPYSTSMSAKCVVERVRCILVSTEIAELISFQTTRGVQSFLRDRENVVTLMVSAVLALCGRAALCVYDVVAYNNQHPAEQHVFAVHWRAARCQGCANSLCNIQLNSIRIRFGLVLNECLILLLQSVSIYCSVVNSKKVLYC